MEILSASVKNMEISIFGIKIKLGVVILLVLLFWVLWGHVLCSCSRVGLLEGLENITNSASNEKVCKDAAGNIIVCPKDSKEIIDGPLEASGTVGETEQAATINPELPSLSAVEGFVGANTNYGESARFNLSNNSSLNTKKWFTPNLTYKKGTDGGKGVQNILNRPKQAIPLPEGEMLMFANTQFKPECCPNAYSNSTGCACMDVGQYNYLINRGGNNVPYSEY
jgi:hypothetical protein